MLDITKGQGRFREVIARTTVDADVFRWAKDFNWFFRGRGLYPATCFDYEVFSLHRLIMDCPPSLEVDHIDGNTLNNLKSNLRVATRLEQNQNLSGHRISSSQYRGVSWSKSKGKWRADSCLNREKKFLGWFDTEEEANSVAIQFRAEHMPFAVIR